MSNYVWKNRSSFTNLGRGSHLGFQQTQLRFEFGQHRATLHELNMSVAKKEASENGRESLFRITNFTSNLRALSQSLKPAARMQLNAVFYMVEKRPKYSAFCLLRQSEVLNKIGQIALNVGTKGTKLACLFYRTICAPSPQSQFYYWHHQPRQ